MVDPTKRTRQSNHPVTVPPKYVNVWAAGELSTAPSTTYHPIILHPRSLYKSRGRLTSSHLVRSSNLGGSSGRGQPILSKLTDRVKRRADHPGSAAMIPQFCPPTGKTPKNKAGPALIASSHWREMRVGSCLSRNAASLFNVKCTARLRQQCSTSSIHNTNCISGVAHVRLMQA